jgi:NADH:ubiquinone oxidoreductase subunit E/NAD-dependent dihydropyrimidine dehydrogenase PreA subunit
MSSNGQSAQAALKPKAKEPSGAVLVAGGGIAGIQASLDLSAAGFRVYLVEQSASIGGGMARLDKTFPTGDCATCIISPKLVECMRDYNIDVMTMTDIRALQGEAGNFSVTIEQRPRGVDASKCTGCGDCWTRCPVHNVPQPTPDYVPESALAPSDIELFDRVAKRYQNDPAPLLPILQDLNSERGYLPRAMLEHLAQRLDTPLSEILRVASFYNAFNLEPVGRHVIEVCLGTACFVRGSGLLLQRLQDEIGVPAGGTDSKQRFTLKTVRCIGCCALAPAMRIDGITFGQVKLDRVSQVLERFV